MKSLNNICYIVYFLLLTNCSNTKYLYEDVNMPIKGITKTLYDNYDLYKDEKSLIVFESDFNNEIKVINNNNVIFDRTIKTKPALGFAAPCIIDNSRDVLIFFDNKRKILVKSEKINKYKFIYINKNKNKYSIVFTNMAHAYR
ncbi:hypothetical protein [Chryseobacterium sp. JUb7]|uniref:hypothetical protein n=1 Tax=Chryseobacterium sp. JUb7 TaxID=2940599 RepID=UPI0021690D0B|nr:hypothetical protein [Chryseobacterium sp. JUb7]MCS3533073.1 hypothetical protein [Chryseobacterium sp. JUb7]